MIVDISNLKVGDSIQTRDGKVYLVKRVEFKSFLKHYEVTTDILPGEVFSGIWCLNKDGTLSDLIVPNDDDIVEIIQQPKIIKFAESQQGVKHDQNKPDFSLLTRQMLEPATRALMHGQSVYSRGNFRKGFDNTRLCAASLRHIYAYLDREDNDPESGVSHLGHACAALFILLDNITNNVSTDNRYTKENQNGLQTSPATSDQTSTETT